MWYSDCPYLVLSKAFSGWREDSSICTKVDNVLKDSKVYAQVQKCLNGIKGIKLSNTTVVKKNLEVFTIVYTILTAILSKIELFLIHNGGLNVYVCNSKSVHIYTKLRDIDSDKYLSSGARHMKIEN